MKRLGLIVLILFMVFLSPSAYGSTATFSPHQSDLSAIIEFLNSTLSNIIWLLAILVAIIIVLKIWLPSSSDNEDESIEDAETQEPTPLEPLSEFDSSESSSV